MDLKYLAAPYSHRDPKVMAQRAKLASKAAALLFKSGMKVFSPLSHSHPIVEQSGGRLFGGFEDWKEYDFFFLSKCTELFVLMLPGWEDSIGVIGEIKYAHKLDIPIRWVKLHSQFDTIELTEDITPEALDIYIKIVDEVEA